MGLVQRDGINRLRHVMRYSRPADDDLHLAAARPAGWPASAAPCGPDPREMARLRPDRDVGRQPGRHPGQRDDACRARAEGARREAGGRRPLPHRHRRGGRHAPRAAARHRRRAGLRGDARAFRDGYADRDYHGALRRLSRPDWKRIWQRAVAGLGGGDHRACRSQQIEDFARLYGTHAAQLYPPRLRLRALAQRRGHRCTR